VDVGCGHSGRFAVDQNVAGQRIGLDYDLRIVVVERNSQFGRLGIKEGCDRQQCALFELLDQSGGRGNGSSPGPSEWNVSDSN